jgi:hypothetical protein
MPKNLKFASERRSDQRKKVIQAEMLQAQTFIQIYLPLPFFFKAYQHQQHLRTYPEYFLCKSSLKKAKLMN